ncbi:hypothetical protein Droror1_Dr00008227 [Drosera rotundifolia]
MARQPLPHPRLVGLVHALECDAVFCDDALGLGMAMMRRFAICDDAAILQMVRRFGFAMMRWDRWGCGKGKQWLPSWISLMWVGRLGCEAVCRIHRILIKNAGVGSKMVRLYTANGYLEETHQVFNEMSERDDCVFWVVIILAWICKRRY